MVSEPATRTVTQTRFERLDPREAVAVRMAGPAVLADVIDLDGSDVGIELAMDRPVDVSRRSWGSTRKVMAGGRSLCRFRVGHSPKSLILRGWVEPVYGSSAIETGAKSNR